MLNAMSYEPGGGPRWKTVRPPPQAEWQRLVYRIASPPTLLSALVTNE